MFSNQKVREHLQFRKVDLFSWIRKLGKGTRYFDEAKWITNGIAEFEKFEDIELHIVSHHEGISGIQDFTCDNITYHFYQSEDDNIVDQILKRINDWCPKYKKNAQVIDEIVRKINPDIVHIIGAENPIYGAWVRYFRTTKPLIIQLQTLMSEDNFRNNYPITQRRYEYRTSFEKEIIRKADYIGTRVSHFKDIILNDINADAKFIDVSLAVAEPIEKNGSEKIYDFVYFALDIQKAADWALEAFAIAVNNSKNLKLLVVGGYSLQFKQQLDSRIKELGIEANVFFSGKMPTHADVIREIQKAKFGLLPLKVDMLTGTIRECIYCDMPVVTNITPVTPQLNEKRISLLISEKGDFKAMADNMIKLVEDEELSDLLRKNALLTVNERYSNKAAMELSRQAYHDILGY